MLKLPQMPAVTYEVTPLNGGLDQVTSSYNLAPGALRQALNYGCKPEGGYYRIPGYERFDGQAEPHLANFITISVEMGAGFTIFDMAVGDSGSFGNATGTIAEIDAQHGYIVLTKSNLIFTDVFVAGDIIINAVTMGTATEIFTQLDIKELSVHKAFSSDIYRADITVVPGEGAITGVAYFGGVAYAFRNNVGSSATDIYKSSPSGWVNVPLGEIIHFDGASTGASEGDTLTQGGITATIDRIVVTASTASAGTIAGYYLISGRAGGSFSNGAASIPGGAVTLSESQTQIVLAPNGNYTLDVATFATSLGSERIYGADGVNAPFEFDGTHYLPLESGYSVPPSIAYVHADHLFLGIGTSLVHSAIGNPYNFEVLLGAGEIAAGATITDLSVLPGNQTTKAMAVYAHNSTWILYGTSSANWNFASFNTSVGAWPRSAQNLFDIFAMDDRGVTTMRQSLNYGNFESGTITHNIQKFINNQRGKLTASGISRENSQYRAFFNDGFALYSTVTPQGVIGHGIAQYAHNVTCCFDGEEPSGATIQLFGTDDGYIMRNDVGSSFDGNAIVAVINTNINSIKSPRLRKRFRRCVIEVIGTSYAELEIGYSFDWASPDVLPHLFSNGSTELSSISSWDNFIWDSFFWDGKTVGSTSVNLEGTGENLQLMIISNSPYSEEFTVSSAIFHYTPRRGVR